MPRQSDNMITYQVSMHYLTKIALRIESLYESILSTTASNEPSLHYLALLQTKELCKLIEKPELKSRFLKELMRFDYTLNKQIQALSETLQASLQEQIHRLSTLTHRFLEKLHHESMLQLTPTPTGHHHDINLDPPPLVYWLAQSSEIRKQNIHQWLSYLKVIYDAVKLYLSVIRQATPFIAHNAQHGFYQQSFQEKKICYLIMLRIHDSVPFVPKIEVGHYGVSVRFCENKHLKVVHQTNIDFELAVCLLH